MFVLFLFPLLSVIAQAQESIPVEVVVKAELRQQVKAADGRTVVRYVPATSLEQGDEVFFTLRIRNATPVVAPDVSVVWPIPTNTVYQPNSASGPAAEITFSADGGANFAPAGQVRKLDGMGSLRTATPGEYTHIRWRLRYPLAPGATAIARFRAVFR